MKSLFRDTVLYGFSAALSRSVGLLIMPVIARWLGVVEYGVVAMTGVIAAVVTVLADLQISAGMGRHYYEQADGRDRKCWIGTGFWVIASMSLLASTVLVTTGKPVSAFLFGQPGFQDAVWIVACQVPFQTLLAYLLYVLRLAGRLPAYIASSAVASVGGAVTSILLVTQADLGWRGAVIGIALGQLLGFFPALFWTRNVLGLTISPPALRSMLAYGLPALPAVVGGVVQQAFGVVFLGRFLSLGDVGVYSVGLRVSQVVSVLRTSFGLSWHPYILKSLHDKTARDACRVGLGVYFGLTLPALALLTLFAPEIVQVLAGPMYAPAAAVLPVVCLGEFLFGLVPIVNTGIIASKRTYLASCAYAVSVAVTVGGTIAFGKTHGPLGAGMALMAGRLVHVIATEWFSRSIGWGLSGWGVVITGMTVGGGIVLGGGCISQQSWVVRTLAAGLFCSLCLWIILRWQGHTRAWQEFLGSRRENRR